MVLYNVDSDEQEAMVWAGEEPAAYERFASNIPEPVQEILVMKVTSPQDEPNAADARFNWDASGAQYRVIDYRGR